MRTIYHLPLWPPAAPCTPQIHNLTQASDPSTITVHYTTPNPPSTNYIVTAVGHMDTHHCQSPSASCELTQLPCGTVYEVAVVASNPAGVHSQPSFSVPLETGERGGDMSGTLKASNALEVRRYCNPITFFK